jgi:two-component system response regulator MprA
MASMRVLIVDDDEAVRTSLAHALKRDGYEVSQAADGLEALQEAAGGQSVFAAIVLDVLIPEPNGLEVCRLLRGRGDETPILMLTARDLIVDRVAGLDAGADDYLVKPFALDELRARLRALLRRTGQAGEVLAYADLELDLAQCRVRRGERQIALTRTEYAMLELFLRNPKRVLSRAAIFDAVWGYDFGPGSNALWVYISYLRTKLEAGGEPRLIQTVRGLGYVLREEP